MGRGFILIEEKLPESVFCNEHEIKKRAPKELSNPPDGERTIVGKFLKVRQPGVET
ncbi:hypothetical protein D3C76_1442080 [compost metagenome]